MTGAAKGRGVHWRRAEDPRAACGAEISPDRNDWRESPELVLCPDCRWAWLVAELAEQRDMMQKTKDQMGVLAAILFPEANRP